MSRVPLGRPMSGRLAIAVLGSLLAASVSLGCKPKPKMLGGGIHGHVVAQLRGKGEPGSASNLGRVELPGAQVTATKVGGGGASQPVETNAHGYFQIPQLDAGDYQVCADAPGFTTRCLAANVSVTNWTVVLSDEILLAPKDTAIVGRVLLGGPHGVPCFTDRPAFRTFVAAKVTLQNANGAVVAGPVSGNGVGQFVLPAVQVPAGQYQLVAACEKVGAHANVSPSGTEVYQDLILPNRPPSVLRLESTLGNQPVRVAPTGSTVTLSAIAQDPDGDPLQFKWVDSNGTAFGASTPTAQLTLGPNPSSTTAYVEASDGRGGFAYSLVPVTGAPGQDALFSGSVVDSNSGAPISGASVRINSSPVTTDANGLFTLSVPPDIRYAISVRKLGFALLSKATYAPAAPLRLPLEPVAGAPFSVGEGGRIVPKKSRKPSLPVVVTVPANNLVDANGSPASGQGIAYVWGYPLGTSIPGDMSAVSPNGANRLETLGAVDIVLTDTAGQPLQVKQGGKVDLSMSAAGQPNPPATVPLFLFDEDKGMWLERGTWKLVGTEYLATVDHLTAFNADLAFNTTGCIEYRVDVENSPSLPFYLHIEQGGQTANHEPFFVSDFSGVVSRLRPAEATDWWVLPSPTSPMADAIGSGTVTSSNFTSDPADPSGDFPTVGQKDANGNPLCTVFTLTAQFPNHETYLTGLPGPTAPTDEANYRAAVDTWSAGAHTTFGDFKATNGFPAGESTAVYFNNGDLRLGRDMHCRVASGNRVACYVSNYLDKAQPPASSALALQAAANAHTSGNTALLFATVAMEWDSGPPLDTSVQFYVYDGAGVRVNQATLDSEGPKSVPQICMACHGGSYLASGDHLAHGSRFLPFDIASFRHVDDDFSAQAVTQFGFDAFTRQNQLGQFRGLNALVAQTEASRATPNPVLDLITGWYGGCGGVTNGACGTCVGGAGCPDSFRGGWRPGAWEGSAEAKALYDNVVRPDCRGCHVMQQSFPWTDVAQFTGPFKSLIQSRVCTSSQRRMPHAEVPFKAFWHSSVASELLKQAPMNFPQCQRQ